MKSVPTSAKSFKKRSTLFHYVTAEFVQVSLNTVQNFLLQSTINIIIMYNLWCYIDPLSAINSKLQIVVMNSSFQSVQTIFYDVVTYLTYASL